jgi:hypothetical protein
MVAVSVTTANQQQILVQALVDATLAAHKESPDEQVDAHLEKIYDLIKNLAGLVGISAFSLPRICGDCGRKRRQSVPDGPVGLGDVLAVFFSWLGFRKCEACERRRQALNRFRLHS